VKFPIHPFGSGPIATIREDSERADTWRMIFGGLTAPIKTAVPFVCVLPGVGRALVYDIDTARLDEASLDRLIDFARATFAPDRDRAEVREDIVRRFGFPIHADDVSTVTNEHPEALIAGLDAEIAKTTGVAQPSLVHKRNLRVESISLVSAPGPYDLHTVSHVPPLTVVGTPPSASLAAIIGQHVGSHAFSPVMVDGPNGPEPIKHDPERTRADVQRIRDEGLQAVRSDFANDLIYECDLPELYAIPDGASIGDVSIPAGNITAQQVADLIGGTVVGPCTILSPPLAMHSAESRIVYAAVLEPEKRGAMRGVTESDMLSAEQVNEMRRTLVGESRILSMHTSRTLSGEILDDSDIPSDSDDLPPAICSCLTDGTPLGPHCVRARECPFRGDELIDDKFVGVQRVRKHGGASTCPRRCSECMDGAHHFSELDIQPIFALDMSDKDLAALDDDEREEVELLRKHPAHLAGCESWYECRHCDAWLEACDADMSDDEDDEADGECDDDDDSPDSDDYDDDDDDDPWELNDESDGGASSDGTPLSVAMRAALIGPPTNDDRTEDQKDVRSVSIPSWAQNLADDILFAARFLNLVNVRVPNSIAVQWSAVVATWPADVRDSVCAWLGPQAPGREQGPTRENAPAAVRALVEQANGGES
jgi:hypothetical protein